MMRRVSVLLAALVVFLGGVVYANAQGETFTGCLTPGGDLKNVALGDTPAGECKGNSEEVSWNATGPEGPPGPPGLLGYEVIEETLTFEEPGAEDPLWTVEVLCPVGKKVIAGSGPLVGPITEERNPTDVVQSRPTATGDGWETAFWISSSSGTYSFDFRVTCAHFAG